MCNFDEYVELHGEQFSKEFGLPYNIKAVLKNYGAESSLYDDLYKELNVPVNQGRLVFLLSAFYPYNALKETLGPVEWITEMLTDTETINVLTLLGSEVSN